MTKTTDYHATLLHDLRCDPQEAIEYLRASLEDGNWPVILMTVRDIEEAYRDGKS